MQCIHCKGKGNDENIVIPVFDNQQSTISIRLCSMNKWQELVGLNLTTGNTIAYEEGRAFAKFICKYVHGRFHDGLKAGLND